MTFWQRKLLAFLHDPPSGCFDRATRQQRSGGALAVAGCSENERRVSLEQAEPAASL